MIGGSSAILTSATTTLSSNHYFNPYSRYQYQHPLNVRNNVNNNKQQFQQQLSSIMNNNNVSSSNHIYRAVPTTITSSSSLSSSNIPQSKEQDSTNNRKTLEDFYVSKNNHHLPSSSPLSSKNSTATKRPVVDYNNQSMDNFDLSEHGTFSGCSSSISMTDDNDFDGDVDDFDDVNGGGLSSESSNNIIDNKLGKLMSTNNDNCIRSSTKSIITQPLSSTSICSTASTSAASSFVYDGHNHNHNHHYRTRNGSTSTSSCSNRDLFLIDDEIADQPELLISGGNNGSNVNVEIARQQRTINVSQISKESIEKDWPMSPTKTLTPTTTNSTNTNNSGSSLELTTISSNIDDFSLSEQSPTTMNNKQKSINSPTNTTTSSYDSMLQSLNNELENLILQTTQIDSSTSTTAKQQANSLDSNEIDSSDTNISSQNIKRIASSKLRKRHSYTSSTNTSNLNNKVPVFRRPRPLSFVEKDDRSFGLDQPSLRAVAQDLIGIKTLLFRLQNVLQNVSFLLNLF